MVNELEANQQVRKPAWRIPAILSRTYRSVICKFKKPYRQAADLLLKMYDMALQAVGPKAGGMPSNHTVVWALFAFMFFLVFASLAVRFPTYKVKAAFLAISSLLICALSILVWTDFATVSEGEIPHWLRANATLTKYLIVQREYRRNLGNSILTVFFTMILLTIVYSRAWYHDLNILVYQLQEDILVWLSSGSLSVPC